MASRTDRAGLRWVTPSEPRDLRIAGYSFVELLVAMVILGVLTKMGLPHFDARRMQIINTQRLVIANLRLARTTAITRSVHVQVSFPSTTQIQTSRMTGTDTTNPDGTVTTTWAVDGSSTKTVSLPSTTSFKSGASGSIEFNTRGFVVALNAVQQIDVQDTFSITKSLQLWPSGQVNEL